MKSTNIIAVDPSFTRTGVAIFKDGILVTKSLKNPTSNYKIDVCLKHSLELAKQLQALIQEQKLSAATLCYEYPILASRSGAYLAVLMAKFDSMFRWAIKNGYLSQVLYVPSTAVPAYTGLLTNDKTGIVNFAKSLVPDKKFNHDEATAVILAHIADDILQGEYKKSYYLLKE